MDKKALTHSQNVLSGATIVTPVPARLRPTFDDHELKVLFFFLTPTDTRPMPVMQKRPHLVPQKSDGLCHPLV